MWAGILSNLANKELLITNGDVITDISYEDLLTNHRESQNKITIALKKHKMQNPYGVVKIKDGLVSSIEEKPTYSSLINTGVYAIDTSILKHLAFNEYCDMPSLIKLAIDKNYRIGAYHTDKYWIDVGTPEDLKRAESRS